ncbi:MAG TPA: hypothetical protein VGW79_02885 [Actinomycetota bacterium]|nr:hypothetical protein [Actinomycetota bacterium]
MQLDELLRREVTMQSVEPHVAIAAFDQVIARGRLRLRRRRIVAWVGAAVAVGLAVSLSTLIVATGSQSSGGFIRPGPSAAAGHGGLSEKEFQLAVQAAQHAASLPGLHPPGWPSNLDEAEAVPSYRSTATMTLMHGITDGPLRRVIVIRMSGAFPWLISHPSGWSPPTPTANSLSIIIDAQTGEPLDSSLGNDNPDISALGKVVVLYRAESQLIGVHP